MISFTICKIFSRATAQKAKAAIITIFVALFTCCLLVLIFTPKFVVMLADSLSVIATCCCELFGALNNMKISYQFLTHKGGIIRNTVRCRCREVKNKMPNLYNTESCCKYCIFLVMANSHILQQMVKFIT